MHNRNDKAIADLATSYHAYLNAMKDKNAHAIVAWAACLLADQTITGVELVPATRINYTIALWQEEAGKIY